MNAVSKCAHGIVGQGGKTVQRYLKRPEGQKTVRPDITILALGGASWARLGSDGKWIDALSADSDIAAFQPSNCGFSTGWRKFVGSKFGGTPLKSVALSFGGENVRGEAMITENGIEGGAVYVLSSCCVMRFYGMVKRFCGLI